MDKRTKEYRDSQKNLNKSKGLGDDIEKILVKTGVKKAVKFLFKEDCGCDDRKEWLNKKYPNKNIECLREDEYNYLKVWFSVDKIIVSYIERVALIAIYNRVLNKKQKPTTCEGCMGSIISQLKQVFIEYPH